MTEPKQTVVRARVDASLKSRAQGLLNEQDLDLSKALRLFLKAVVRFGGMPAALFPERKSNTSGQTAARLATRNRDAISKAKWVSKLTSLEHQLLEQRSRPKPSAKTIERLQRAIAEHHASRFDAPSETRVSIGRERDKTGRG